jgi:hypothetical protein
MVKNALDYTSVVSYAPMRWYLNKHRDNLTFQTFALLGRYAAQIGSYIPTFRNNVDSYWTMFRGLLWSVGTYYQSKLQNIP